MRPRGPAPGQPDQSPLIGAVWVITRCYRLPSATNTAPDSGGSGENTISPRSWSPRADGRRTSPSRSGAVSSPPPSTRRSSDAKHPTASQPTQSISQRRDARAAPRTPQLRRTVRRRSTRPSRNQPIGRSVRALEHVYLLVTVPAVSLAPPTCSRCVAAASSSATSTERGSGRAESARPARAHPIFSLPCDNDPRRDLHPHPGYRLNLFRDFGANTFSNFQHPSGHRTS